MESLHNEDTEIIMRVNTYAQAGPKNEANARFCLRLSNDLTKSNNVWYT